MYHIANDLRAKKSAALVLEGLYKTLEEKPYKDIKVKDVSENCYVSRATFYRLFDSIYDVLLYQCDRIVDELLESMKRIKFETRREQGLYCMKLWFKRENLIKVMVENRMSSLLYDSIMNHIDGLYFLYGIDYQSNPDATYFVYFLVSMIYTFFIVFHREKGKKTAEEVFEMASRLIAGITKAWALDN